MPLLLSRVAGIMSLTTTTVSTSKPATPMYATHFLRILPHLFKCPFSPPDLFLSYTARIDLSSDTALTREGARCLPRPFPIHPEPMQP